MLIIDAGWGFQKLLISHAGRDFQDFWEAFFLGGVLGGVFLGGVLGGVFLGGVLGGVFFRRRFRRRFLGGFWEKNLDTP